MIEYGIRCCNAFDGWTSNILYWNEKHLKKHLPKLQEMYPDATWFNYHYNDHLVTATDSIESSASISMEARKK